MANKTVKIYGISVIPETLQLTNLSTIKKKYRSSKFTCALCYGWNSCTKGSGYVRVYLGRGAPSMSGICSRCVRICKALAVRS